MSISGVPFIPVAHGVCQDSCSIFLRGFYQFFLWFIRIEHHRYPAKNALIIQIGFKLGLRAQEMSLLRISEIAALSDESTSGYNIKDVLVLPKSFTTGARAMRPSEKNQ